MSDAMPKTPLMRQYAEIKKQHPDALLFFRLGDFYELFFEDAVVAARELQITLTSRNKEKENSVPMCGVPFHAAENYIARLIRKGFRVAICDQMEDPKQAKTIVRREVTRVVTPGTASFQTEPSENNYLAAVARGKDGIGLALMDLSTGEFRATELTGAHAAHRLQDELAHWQPREILYASTNPLFSPQLDGEPVKAVLTPLEDWLFDTQFARSVLEAHFGVLSLEGYGLQEHDLAMAAAGVAVHYVKETQRSQIAHVDRLGYYERHQGLTLDATTARNLELVEPALAGSEATTLRAVLDEAVTPMGKRLLRNWLLRPSADQAEIEGRHDAVDALVKNWTVREQVRETLGDILDLERLLSRISLETATPRDLLALKASLDQIPELRRQLAQAGAAARRLSELHEQLDELPELRRRIGATLVDEPPASLADGGVIRSGVDAELDELRDLSHNAKGIIAQIEARERSRTGIGSLKVRFNNVFGYYIEVSRPNLHLVPADYERKQTLVNAERFTTPELKELEVKILSAEEKIAAIEKRLFVELRAAASACTAEVRRNAAAIAEADLLANFAHLAATYNYTRPVMLPRDTAEAMEIRGGRHPVVERLGLEGVGDRFVPNDLYLNASTDRILIITGPNMGGKSTYLRQAALLAILAQMGSFVPAETARIPLFDRIFTRIGASDNLSRGRSTFMVEMTETAVILNNATPHSLVILDEIGRGTSTYDGLSLAWAVVEYIHRKVGARTIFATHYHELTDLAQHLPGVKNLHVSVKESPGGVVFLRKVEPGEANRSYGIEVARLAGLPGEVIQRARTVLHQHERAEKRATIELEPESAAVQLTMFTPLSQQIVDRLASTDINQLTPIEALNLLAELQRQVTGA